MNKDDEFLLWISKRLVFKYGENKEILDIVNAIVSKNQAIYKVLDTMISTMSEKISENINSSSKILTDLQNCKKTIIDSVNESKNKILLSKFEDIDISSLLKS